MTNRERHPSTIEEFAIKMKSSGDVNLLGALRYFTIKGHGITLITEPLSEDWVFWKNDRRYKVPRGKVVVHLDEFFGSPNYNSEIILNGMKGLLSFFEKLDRLSPESQSFFNPRVLLGDTNQEMADFAVKHLGFTLVKHWDKYDGEVIGVIGAVNKVRLHLEKLIAAKKNGKNLLNRLEERIEASKKQSDFDTSTCKQD